MRPDEQHLLESIDLAEPWALVERFATLTRVSGSADERAAAEYIAGRLAALGVPHEVYRPKLYLSVPLSASVTVHAPDGGRPALDLVAKTPSFSASTTREKTGMRTGHAIFVPSGAATGIGDLFAGPDAPVGDLSEAVAVAEGMPMPSKVLAFQRQGAVAAVFISPGERIHEGICTSIWGTPDLTSHGRRPRLAVASVSRPDGLRLLEKMRQAQGRGQAVRLEVRTELDERWKECPLVVAEIPGREWPDEFVLVHGHLDSWHVGIGDNAVGNATLLELARVFWQRRAHLPRSVRMAWWPGHSTGRYAGSTWYADRFARDIYRNCVVHLNCDSPGCRWTTVFEEIAWMAETESLARSAIRDVTGLEAEGSPPQRAGDLSFSNLGIPTLFMLSSTMSGADRATKGYYAVGGCGGNIQWHTEADTIEIADRENLLRDMRVYALAAWRAAAEPVHPLDYRTAAAEIEGLLAGFAGQLGEGVDLSAAGEAALRLRATVDGFYKEIVEPAGSTAAPGGNGPSSLELAGINARLRKLGRILANLVYSQDGRYRQDPALPVRPLPELAAAVAALKAGDADPGFVRTDVVRACNRIVGAAEEAMGVLGGG